MVIHSITEGDVLCPSQKRKIHSSSLKALLARERVTLESVGEAPGSTRPTDRPGAVSSDLLARLMLGLGMEACRSLNRQEVSGKINVYKKLMDVFVDCQHNSVY